MLKHNLLCYWITELTISPPCAAFKASHKARSMPSVKYLYESSISAYHFFATSKFSVTTFCPGSTVTVNPLVLGEA